MLAGARIETPVTMRKERLMLFMVIERFRDNDMLPIYKLLAGQRAYVAGRPQIRG